MPIGRRGKQRPEELNDELHRSQRRRFARRPGATRRSTPPPEPPPAPEPSPTTEGAVRLGPEQWEFCQLIFTGASQQEGRWWADLTIYYIGEPNRSAQLSTTDSSKGKSWATATGPWRAALAKLGLGGWELVSVQHGPEANDAVAYLKRGVQAGRSVNNPEIVI
jgi:hypothetical protein